MNWLRQAYLSYRGLFLWLNWQGYVSNVIVRPILLLCIYLLAGRFADSGPAQTWYIVGMALYGIPAILIGGVLQTFYYERAFGTLSLIYTSPANRVLVYWSRALFHSPNGIISALVTFGFAAAVFGFQLTNVHWGYAVLTILMVTWSSTCFCMAVGNFAIVFREWQFSIGVLYGLLLLLTGVIIPRDALPEVLALVGSVLPLTHGVEALRDGISGADPSRVQTSLLIEFVIGCGYAALGTILFLSLERVARARGTII